MENNMDTPSIYNRGPHSTNNRCYYSRRPSICRPRSAKILECYYWRTSGCNYAEPQYLYAHRSTGQMAEQPVYDERAGRKVAGNNRKNISTTVPENIDWRKAHNLRPVLGPFKGRECYFWRHFGKCRYEESKCAFAHRSTGRPAVKPALGGGNNESDLAEANENVGGTIAVKLPPTPASLASGISSDQRIRPYSTVSRLPSVASLPRGESSDQNAGPNIPNVEIGLDRINEGKQSVLYSNDFTTAQSLNTFLRRSVPLATTAISALQRGAATQAATHKKLLNKLRRINPARDIPASEVAVLVEQLNGIKEEIDMSRAYLETQARDELMGWYQLENDMKSAGLGL